MSVIYVCIRDHMYQFSRLKARDLGKHMYQYRILDNIPVVGRKHILGSLIQYSVEPVPCYIECHAVRARIQIHLTQVLMNIYVSEHSSAVWVILKVIYQSVHLIHHALFIFMLYTKLISICFSYGTVLICPTVPYMAFEIMNII